VVYELLHYSA